VARSVGAFLICGVGAAAALPYLYAEAMPWLSPHSVVDAAPAKLSKGRMVDDYFAVQDLGEGVFAIGEPRPMIISAVSAPSSTLP
jgi:hydroxyacylglutathione hydrolase